MEELAEEAFCLQVLKVLGAPVMLSPRRYMPSVRETTFRILRELDPRMLMIDESSSSSGPQPAPAAALSLIVALPVERGRRRATALRMRIVVVLTSLSARHSGIIVARHGRPVDQKTWRAQHNTSDRGRTL